MLESWLIRHVGTTVMAVCLTVASGVSAQSLDTAMEDAALDMWRGFPPGEKYRIAVSTIKPDWSGTGRRYHPPR